MLPLLCAFSVLYLAFNTIDAAHPSNICTKKISDTNIVMHNGYIKIHNDQVSIQEISAWDTFYAFIQTQKEVKLYQVEDAVGYEQSEYKPEFDAFLAKTINTLGSNLKLKTFTYTYDEEANELMPHTLTTPVVSALANNLKAITKFGLKDVKLEPQEGMMLINFIQNHPTLERLSLICCKIPETSIKVLFASLKFNSKLKKLNVYDTCYEVDSSHDRTLGNKHTDLPDILANSLRSNSSLTALNLGWMNADGYTPTNLIVAISDSSSITKLCFQAADINAGNVDTYQKLLQSKSLQKLNLKDSFDNQATMIKWLPGFSNNTTLTELNLSGHYVTIKLAQFIRRHLIDSNNTLQTITLHSISVDPQKDTIPNLSRKKTSNALKQKISDLLTSNTTKIVDLHFSKRN